MPYKKFGAGDGVRTRDPQLGRLMLYQLSYSRTILGQFQSPIPHTTKMVVEGEGFEPSKATPTDLQSVPFGRSGTSPTNHSYKQLASLELLMRNPQNQQNGAGDGT
jgi:hypothetical protein